MRKYGSERCFNVITKGTNNPKSTTLTDKVFFSQYAWIYTNKHSVNVTSFSEEILVGIRRFPLVYSNKFLSFILKVINIIQHFQFKNVWQFHFQDG